MKILLTGASGFLGGCLNRLLIHEGYTVLSLGHSISIANNINIAKPFKFPTGTNVDVIFHAAGKAHSIPKTEAERKAFYDVNFEGTKNLCAAISALKELPKAFIFVSTVAVYGIDTGRFIKEDHPLNGQTAYAKSKIMAEKWLDKWCQAKGVNLSILRLPLVAGPNPPGNLGAMIKGIKTGKYLSIGDGDAKKSMIWAEDIAHIIPKLSELGGIYNLTDGQHPSFRELEEIISSTLHKKKPIKIPLWAARWLGLAGDVIGLKFPLNSDKVRKITSHLTFDDTKARSILGWEPTQVLSKIHEII